MTNYTYYEILGIEENATQEEIKKAYWSLAKEYHPDVNHAQNANTMFRFVQDAYETLSDPRKKTEYDNNCSAPKQYPADKYSDYGDYSETGFQIEFNEHIYDGWSKKECQRKLKKLKKSLDESAASLTPEEKAYRIVEIMFLQKKIKSSRLKIADILFLNSNFPILEAIAIFMVAACYFYGYLHINGIISLIVAAAISLAISILFCKKISSWIISIICSAAWATPLGWQAYWAPYLSEKNLWCWFFSGIIFIIALSIHRCCYNKSDI